LGQVLLTNSVTSFGQIKMRSLVRLWKSAQMRRLSIRIVQTYTRYGSLDSYDSAALKQVKKSNMDSDSVKELIFGSIKELSKNRKYYYHSAVGINYSHWTDEGNKALSDFMNIMVHKLHEAEEAELNKRAKELVIKGLKGESV